MSITKGKKHTVLKILVVLLAVLALVPFILMTHTQIIVGAIQKMAGFRCSFALLLQSVQMKYRKTHLKE